MRKHYAVTILIVGLLSTGCMFSSSIKQYPLSENVKVLDNRIYDANKLFAELRYFTIEGNLAGIAIYYHKYDKEVWIYPKEGWSIEKDNTVYFMIQEVDMIWNNHLREREKWIEGKADIPKMPRLILGGVNRPKLISAISDMKISEDGKYIFYNTSGFFNKHKYRVEYGNSK